MTQELEELKELRAQHELCGKEIFEISEGKLFPGHVLYLAMLNRSLEIFDCFIDSAEHDRHTCCMAIFRMQLDNVLRFYGVLITGDPHETANQVINGTQLNKIKDSTGHKLTDSYLAKKMGEKNSWVQHVYKIASGHIHLSDQHLKYFLTNSKPAGDGKSDFFIGPGASNLDKSHKTQLSNAFKVVTQGVFDLLPEWKKQSQKYKEKDLMQKYSRQKLK